jgi:hypothetical protein
MEEDGEGYRRLRRFREVVVNESAKVGASCPYLRVIGVIAFIIFPSTRYTNFFIKVTTICCQLGSLFVTIASILHDLTKTLR